MLYRRIYSGIWLMLISCSLFYLSATAGIIYAEDTGISIKTRKELEHFLAQTFSSSSLVENLLANLTADRNGRFVSASNQSGGFYSLVLCPIQQDADRDTMSEIEIATRKFASMTARSRLAFYIGHGGVDRNLYRYDDALGKALLSYYTRKELQKRLHEQGITGIETATSIIEGNPEIIIGLAWIAPESSKLIEKDVPELGVLDDEYCRFLYLNRAKGLFQAGKYEEALPLFKNIHDIHWMDVSAYLDAAECFLKIGESKECLTLVKEIRTALNDKMSSKELARAGRLCRTAGDRQAALDAFNQARVRLHEENSYNSMY